MLTRARTPLIKGDVFSKGLVEALLLGCCLAPGQTQKWFRGITASGVSQSMHYTMVSCPLWMTRNKDSRCECMECMEGTWICLYTFSKLTSTIGMALSVSFFKGLNHRLPRWFLPVAPLHHYHLHIPWDVQNFFATRRGADICRDPLSVAEIVRAKQSNPRCQVTCHFCWREKPRKKNPFFHPLIKISLHHASSNTLSIELLIPRISNQGNSGWCSFMLGLSAISPLSPISTLFPGKFAFGALWLLLLLLWLWLWLWLLLWLLLWWWLLLLLLLLLFVVVVNVPPSWCFCKGVDVSVVSYSYWFMV